MHKYLSCVIGLTLAGIASAGQIQIGGANGLTATYMGIANTSERAYTTALFSAMTSITSPSSTLPVGSSTAGANQLVDPNNGVQFNTIAGDSTTGCGSGGTGLCNYWAVSSTLTVPVGLNNIDGVWTLLSDYWGTNGAQNAKVTFNFGTTSSVANLASQSFTLTNGVEIDDAVDCSAAGTSTPNCTTYARTTTSANTSTAWTANYASTITTGPYGGSSGTLNLSDQFFTFTPSANYLVSITIADLSGGLNISRLALSGVTVDQAANTSAVVPEPSTIALLLFGMTGLIGVVHFRRRNEA